MVSVAAGDVAAVVEVAGAVGEVLELEIAPARRYKKDLRRSFVVTTVSAMEIQFDADKRDKALSERGLDFARAAEVFAGATVTAEDARFDYGEQRFTTVGALDGRMVVLVWTPRGTARRIISMRKANEREIAKFAPFLG